MIRNFLFSILFFIGIIFISIIFLPSFFLPKRVVLIGGKLMGHWASFCLRFVLSVKTIEKIKEKDPEMVDNINKLKNRILYNNKENEI